MSRNQKQVTVATKFGPKTFIIQFSKEAIAGHQTISREYTIMDSQKNILAIMVAYSSANVKLRKPNDLNSEAALEHSLHVWAEEVRGPKRNLLGLSSFENAKTHAGMFARIIKKVASRAV